MDPFTMALLASTAMSAAGALSAKGESGKTQKANQQINMMNYQQAERERADRLAAAMRGDAYAREAIAAAQNNQRQIQQGYSDAYGNRVSFQDGQGWTTALAPNMKASLDQRRRIVDDLGREFQGIQREDPEEIRQLYKMYGERGVNEGYDNAISTAMRTATRQGSSNAGTLLAEMNRARGKTLGDNALEAAIRARTDVNNTFNTNRAATAQLYGAFDKNPDWVNALDTGRQGFITGSFGQYKNEDNAFDNLMAGNQTLVSAFGTPGGRIDYQQPDQSVANALGTGANLISSGYNMYANNERLKMLKKNSGVI